MIELKSLVAGMFKFVAVKRDGSRRVLADWFPNLITDNGLNLIGDAFGGEWLRYCQVGTGTAAPNVLDTALASRIAGTFTVSASTSGIQSSAPYFVWRRNTYRFAEGAATGNIAEVGVGASATGNLLSRARILDGSGNPTTISVAADESLDVTYEFRYYPPTVDNTFSLTIGGVEYSVTSRAALVTTESTLGWSISAEGQAPTMDNLNLVRVHNGAIGVITAQPAGTWSNASSVTNAAYSAGSHYREGTATWALSAGNLAGGITAMAVRHGIGMYQLWFSPAIPKDNTKVFEITVRHSWARK